MMSLTHIVIGIASSLAICRPQSTEALLPVLAGASVGSIICDIDCRARVRMLDRLRGWVIVAGLLTGVLIVDDLYGYPLMNCINELSPVFLAARFVFLVCAMIAMGFGPRGFSHSLLAVLIYTGCMYVMVRPVAVPFLIAAVSHLVLDLTNRKPVRILYPVKKGFCLKWFYADRKANTVFLIAGAAWMGVGLYCMKG